MYSICVKHIYIQYEYVHAREKSLEQSDSV